MAPPPTPTPTPTWASTWWPRFHDPAWRPLPRELLATHWEANLAMLRSPAAVGGFLAIAFLPLVGLLAAWWWLGFLDAEDPALARGAATVGILLATLVPFAIVQHLAFVQAMNLTYGPFVRRAIDRRGTPTCLRCGQLLGPDPGPACPECGQPRETRRGLG
jgi:hypothetical protein